MIKNGKMKYYRIASHILFVLFILLHGILAFKVCFNYDEAYTIGMIGNSYAEILDIISRDVHSPVYYWLLKTFCMIPVGNQLILSKIFSLLFMAFFWMLGRIICRKRYSEKVECYWLLCAGWMPAMVLQATNTRMYTMALFVMSLTSWLAYEIYVQEKAWKWILFTAVTVLCIYLHTFCMLEMVFIYLTLIIASLRQRRYSFLKKVFLSGGVVSICYIPWLIVLYHQFSRWAGWESGWSNTISEFGLRSVYDYLAEWFSNLEDPHIAAIVFGIFLCMVTGIYTVRYIREHRDNLPILGVGIIGVTVIFAIAVSVFIVPCFLGRYVFPLFGGLILMVAVGMSEMRNHYLRAALVIGIFLFGLQSYIDETKLENETGLEAYLSCMEEEYEASHVIMADTYFSMTLSIYDPEKEYMIWGSAPECLPFTKYEIFRDWKQLDGVDTVWLISMEDFRVADLSEQFECKESLRIPYSYYQFILEKYERIDNNDAAIH